MDDSSGDTIHDFFHLFRLEFCRVKKGTNCRGRGNELFDSGSNFMATVTNTTTNESKEYNDASSKNFKHPGPLCPAGQLVGYNILHT